jgi:hypothetical protein
MYPTVTVSTCSGYPFWGLCAPGPVYRGLWATTPKQRRCTQARHASAGSIRPVNLRSPTRLVASRDRNGTTYDRESGFRR